MLTKEMIEKGRWWEKGLTLVSGCTKTESEGCRNCWSLAMEKRFHKDGPVTVHPDRLSIPLKTRKSTVFSIWNDLFHEDVPFDFILKAFDRMHQSPRHTFLVLTKRPSRMVEFLSDYGLIPWPDAPHITGSGEKIPDNVWLGLTVVNQQEADEKIPVFLRVPGKKFLSIEPCLSYIDFTPPEYRGTNINRNDWLQEINCIVAGGETGPGSRPTHPNWIRQIRDSCENRTDMGRPWQLPFFFKQFGEWIHCGMVEDETKFKMQMLDGTIMCRVGKKAAGRTLDGKEWNDLPWIESI